ncbi:LCP family protein [Gracilibacillus lacisalsi]|uniref:LCP family glycopolymer transferase n=1 Tax=Gracilibacillus lacisalsi TaxID=393087 RepID=UPI00036432F7|nr:LCP family protein [Gracilibacillus lacisalsi]
MVSKFEKELSSYLNQEDLSFTKDDREKTFNKIHSQTTTQYHNKSSFTRPIVPIMATIAVFILAIALIPSFILNEKQNSEADKSITSAEEGNGDSVLLLMGEDADRHRNPFNLLLTFNFDKESVKVVSLPRDLHVDRYNAEGEKFEKTKLLHVGAHDNDPAASVKTVSHYLDIPIDYYALMPMEEIFQLLGIDDENKIYEIEEQNSLANLLEKDQKFPELMELISHHQTNLTEDIFNQMEKKSNQYDIIQLEEGLNNIFEDEIYYVELEPSFLEKLKNDL